jgi:DNA-binding MarR family transcriptional regulator
MKYVSCIKYQEICQTEVMKAEPEASWTFLTNHAHVLLAIAAEPEIRIRDIAAEVGITERAAHRIVSDLEEAGYLQVMKVGRRNEYIVRRELPLRHPAERHHRIGELLKVLAHDAKK